MASSESAGNLISLKSTYAGLSVVSGARLSGAGMRFADLTPEKWTV
jgi:hypothetical protein